MKKLISTLMLLLVVAVSPVLAAFCHKCGKNLPTDANFCPSCGVSVSGAFVAAPDSTSTASTNTQIVTTGTTNRILDDSSLADYSYINDMEQLLTQTSYNASSRQIALIKSNNASKMTSMEANYLSFSPYRRKVHDLYVLKLRYIDEYLDAWKKGESSGDIGQAKALKNRASFCLNKVDEALDTVISEGGSLSSISKAEEIVDRVKRTTATYIVTSPYLIVSNQRLNRGEPIWIVDVNGAMVKIMHMGVGRSSEPIYGWVSIYDVERRTNWRSDPIFFYSAPVSSTIVLTQPAPRAETSAVFVFGDPFWWHHRHHRHHPTPPPPPRRAPDRNPPSKQGPPPPRR